MASIPPKAAVAAAAAATRATVFPVIGKGASKAPLLLCA